MSAKVKSGLFNIKAGPNHKIVPNQPTIADVCAVCNNGVLSGLDSYGATMYERYFSSPPIPGVMVRFKFDYHRLFRWLIKMWFNTWRAHGWSKTLGQFPSELIDYVRKGTEPVFDLCLFVQLVKPTPIERIPRNEDTEEFFGEHGFSPRLHRIGLAHPIGIPGFGPGLMVGLNSFYFYGFFGLVGAPDKLKKKTMKSFLKETSGSYLLDPRKPDLKLYSSNVDHLTILGESQPFRRNVKLGAEYVRKRREN